MKMFTEEFKKTAVQKFLSRGSRSVKEICRELGVADCSIYQWTKQYGRSRGMDNTQRRPQDWSAAEKLKAVIEFEKLAPEQQGEFLRREGLHSDHIEAWKKSMEAGLDPVEGTKAARSERAQLRAEIKALERDLHKKDKALAEVTAFLVLKKKADLIWGTGENE
jgi:transposase-like protein